MQHTGIEQYNQWKIEISTIGKTPPNSMESAFTIVGIDVFDS